MIPILGYGIVYFLGIRFTKVQLVGRVAYCLIFAVIFTFACILIGFENIQDSKYPPDVLYLSYGLLCSCILYTVFSFVKVNNKIIKWLSANSLNIYFNHIFMIALIDFVCPEMNFILFFIITVIYAVLATFIVNVTIKRLFCIFKGFLLQKAKHKWLISQKEV